MLAFSLFCIDCSYTLHFKKKSSENKMIPSRDFFSIQIACKKSKKKSNLIQKIIGQGIQHMFLQVNQKKKVTKVMYSLLPQRSYQKPTPSFPTFIITKITRFGFCNNLYLLLSDTEDINTQQFPLRYSSEICGHRNIRVHTRFWVSEVLFLMLMNQ